MSRALYRQVTDDLLDKVQTGAIKVGERLPKEEIFAEQLGVSRSTLRLAFTQLEQKGIIRRRKRGGTEVISVNPVERFNILSSNVLDLLSMGVDSTMLVREISLVSHDDVEYLVNYPDVAQAWKSFGGVRIDPQHLLPFASVHIYVPDYYSDIDLKVDDRCPSVYELIENRYGVTVSRVKQTVSAKRCPKAAAMEMGLEEDDPIVSVFLEIWDQNDRIFEICCVYLDPSRVNIEADILKGG